MGNPAGSAVLEITMMGPALEVLGEADMALAGADMALTVNRQPVPMWQTVRVMNGDVIRIRQANSGCRAYLAITGGIDVPVVMGSRATCVKAKIGGLEGRVLKKDDVLGRIPAETSRQAPGTARGHRPCVPTGYRLEGRCRAPGGSLPVWARDLFR